MKSRKPKIPPNYKRPALTQRAMFLQALVLAWRRTHPCDANIPSRRIAQVLLESLEPQGLAYREGSEYVPSLIMFEPEIMECLRLIGTH